MPNEQVANPIEITPVDSFVGKEDQSGHKAVFSGASSKELEEIRHARNLEEGVGGQSYENNLEKIQKEIGLRPVWNHEMTDEEALLELQHGKTNSPEYYEAQQRLVAKFVGTYQGSETEFFQGVNVKVLGVPFFRGDLDRTWTLASHLLGVNISKGLQDKPSKLRMLHALSDTAELYKRAYALTEKYVLNHLVRPNLIKEYNSLDPQLRREMLGLFQLPAGAKTSNDGASGVQEQWMYPPQKPTPPRSLAGPNGPRPTGTPPPGPEVGDAGGPSGPKAEIVLTQTEVVASKYLDKLTDEQRAWLSDNFTPADLILVAHQLDALDSKKFNDMLNQRAQAGGRIVFFGSGANGQVMILNRFVELRERDSFWTDDQRVKNALSNVQEYAERSGLTVEQYIALNMLAYSTEQKAYIEQDFNFKRQLFERYKQEQTKKVASSVVVSPAVPVQPAVTLKPADILDSEEVDDVEDETEIQVVLVPSDIANLIEGDREDGNIPIFFDHFNGTYIGRIYLASYRAYIDNVDQIDPVLLDADIKYILDRLPTQGGIETDESRMRRALLTRDKLLDGEDNTFEDSLRIKLWERYKANIK